MAYARIAVYDNAVVFEAKHESNKDKIDKIIQKNNLTNLSQDQFMEIANQVPPIVHAKKKIRENKVNNFKNMTTEEIAKQVFKIYSSSNQLKYLKIKEKVVISDDFLILAGVAGLGTPAHNLRGSSSRRRARTSFYLCLPTIRSEPSWFASKPRSIQQKNPP